MPLVLATGQTSGMRKEIFLFAGTFRICQVFGMQFLLAMVATAVPFQQTTKSAMYTSRLSTTIVFTIHGTLLCFPWRPRLRPSINSFWTISRHSQRASGCVYIGCAWKIPYSSPWVQELNIWLHWKPEKTDRQYVCLGDQGNVLHLLLYSRVYLIINAMGSIPAILNCHEVLACTDYDETVGSSSWYRSTVSQPA